MDSRNWSIWAQIETNIRNYCKKHWHEPATAADVLSGGLTLFIEKHTGGDYPPPRQIRFAQLCCRASARKQHLSGGREVAGWAELPDPRFPNTSQGRAQGRAGYRRGQGHEQELADLSGLDAGLLRRETRLQQLEQALGSWAAGGDIERLVRLHLGGMTGREAARALGFHPSQATRRLQDLGKKLGAAAPRRRQVRDDGQLGLFAVPQGV